MIEHELPLDENMGESFPQMTFEFPYIWFWGKLDAYVGGHVPWHWHEEPETDTVLYGEVEVHFPGHVEILKEGDAIFVNSNVLHMICAHNGRTDSVIIPQIFNKLLLVGHHRSVFDTRYFNPIINSKNTPFLTLHQDDPACANMLDSIQKSYEYASKEDFGYEFKVRNYLADFWVDLYQALEPSLCGNGSSLYSGNQRLKLMLEYINANYASKLSLEDISTSASISVRECIRCFNKYMNITPFHFLLQLRLEQAANMLLHTDQTITEIALANGFSTSSHFSKQFKDQFHCTPKKYRDVSRSNVKLSLHRKLLDE